MDSEASLRNTDLAAPLRLADKDCGASPLLQKLRLPLQDMDAAAALQDMDDEPSLQDMHLADRDYETSRLQQLARMDSPLAALGTDIQCRHYHHHHPAWAWQIPQVDKETGKKSPCLAAVDNWDIRTCWPESLRTTTALT